MDDRSCKLRDCAGIRKVGLRFFIMHDRAFFRYVSFLSGMLGLILKQRRVVFKTT